MDYNKPKKSTRKEDLSPYNRRGEKITSKAFSSVGKSVEPVAKDTNKTRRKETMSRREGETLPYIKPIVSLKKALSKVKCSHC